MILKEHIVLRKDLHLFGENLVQHRSVKYRTSDQGMMILKNSTWEENNIGLHFSKSWEKNKEVEIIFAIKKKK